MKTKCYCVWCKKHPLDPTNYCNYMTEFDEGSIILAEYQNQGIEVDCFDPVLKTSSDFGLNPYDFVFSETAYGKGVSLSFAIHDGKAVYATCGNEELYKLKTSNFHD
jgi:hypothetical protein